MRFVLIVSSRKDWSDEECPRALAERLMREELVEVGGRESLARTIRRTGAQKYSVALAPGELVGFFTLVDEHDLDRQVREELHHLIGDDSLRESDFESIVLIPAQIQGL